VYCAQYSVSVVSSSCYTQLVAVWLMLCVLWIATYYAALVAAITTELREEPSENESWSIWSEGCNIPPEVQEVSSILQLYKRLIIQQCSMLLVYCACMQVLCTIRSTSNSEISARAVCTYACSCSVYTLQPNEVLVVRHTRPPTRMYCMHKVLHCIVYQALIVYIYVCMLYFMYLHFAVTTEQK
jgi:hypothetical protein